MIGLSVLNKIKKIVLKTNRTKAFLIVSYYLMSVFILIYLQELSYRGFYNIGKWIFFFPKNYMQNYVFILFVFLLMSIITKRLNVPFFIIGVFEILISVINFFAVSLKGNVVTFGDIFLLNEAITILDHYELQITYPMGISLLVLVLCTVVLSKIKIPRIAKPHNYIVIFFLLLIITVHFNIMKDGMGLTTGGFYDYDRRGLLFGMISGISPEITAPDNYNESTIQAIIGNQNYSMGSVMPNIIFIMNESFYDLNQVDWLVLSEDAIPFYRKLTETFSTAKLLVPAYGGGTCQTEYEMLTGFPITATGNRSAYAELIKKETPSLTSFLAAKGYDTVAIHPYLRFVYSRNIAYDLLGFDKKIFQEDMISPLYERGLISDRYVYDLLIAEFEEKGDDPLFAWIVTMQNHGGYSFYYNKHGISVLNNNLSIENNMILTNMANALKESDDSLEYLIAYFEKVSEPTIIVFYGDHSPNLKSEYEAVGAELDPIDAYTTPFVVWNNFGLPYMDYGYINAYMIPAQVMHSIGFMDNYYFNHIMTQALPVEVNGLFLQDNRWMPTAALLDEQIAAKNTLWLLQYDMQFGAWYGLQ